MELYLGLDAVTVCCLLVLNVDFMESCLQKLKCSPGHCFVNFTGKPCTFCHVHVPYKKVGFLLARMLPEANNRSFYEAYFSFRRELFLPQDGRIIIFLLQLGKMNFIKDRCWKSRQIFRASVPYTTLLSSKCSKTLLDTMGIKWFPLHAQHTLTEWS